MVPPPPSEEFQLVGALGKIIALLLVAQWLGHWCARSNPGMSIYETAITKGKTNWLLPSFTIWD